MANPLTSWLQRFSTTPEQRELQAIRKVSRELFSERRKSLQVIFLQRGARNIRLRSVHYQPKLQPPILEFDCEEWPFPPLEDATSHFELIVTEWNDGEEIRYTSEVELLTEPTGSPFEGQLSLPQNISTTTIEFLAEPDPTIPLLLSITLEEQPLQIPILEACSKRFKFRLSSDFEISPDGALMPDSLITAGEKHTLTATLWCKRIGKTLIDAEIDSIRPRDLGVLKDYVKERFFARNVMWDGMKKLDMRDDDGPGRRTRTKTSLGDLKALWVSTLPMPQDWFPGVLEVPSVWQAKNSESIAVEYDAIFGTSDELQNWLPTTEKLEQFEERCAVIELLLDARPHSPSAIISIPANPLPDLNWKALFGWTERLQLNDVIAIHAMFDQRREFHEFAHSIPSSEIVVHWIRKEKLPVKPVNIFVVERQFRQLYALFQRQPTLKFHHRWWTLDVDSTTLKILGIKPVADLQQWITEQKEMSNAS